MNRICDAFLATLEKRIDTNLHNLITAHVCKSPPDLEAGLRLVARLRGQLYHRNSIIDVLLTTVQNKVQNKQKMLLSTCAS